MPTKIEIDLQGHFCHAWPVIEIWLEHQLLDRQIVQGSVKLAYDIEADQKSWLRLRQIGKRFGEDGIWDTDTVAGQDRYITISDVRFDQVSMGDRLLHSLPFRTEWSDLQRQQDQDNHIATYSEFDCNGRMNFNGYIDIHFTQPIYNWLILSKYKTTAAVATAYFSAHTSNWHYEEDLEILREIKELMKLG